MVFFILHLWSDYAFFRYELARSVPHLVVMHLPAQLQCGNELALRTLNEHDHTTESDFLGPEFRASETADHIRFTRV